MSQFMQLALALAETAARQGEVPVGAVIVQKERIIASGFNRRERDRSALGHAELHAIGQACQNLGSWRLSDCVLYVTLEPCLMCAGAISQARISKVVFGAHDPKAGALGSLYQIHEDPRLNHRFAVEAGVLAEPASAMLKEFFRARR